MSFILDALRKSEHERQRQSGPGIAELPVTRADGRLPWALVAIGALLALNAAVLGYFLLRDEPAAAIVPAVEAPPATAAVELAEPPAAAAVAASGVPAAAVPIPEIRPLADEAGAGSGADFAPPAPDPTLIPSVPLVPPAGRVQVLPRESPPAIDVLPAEATAGLPALAMDLHIWADDPARRAVFVNGRRYQEGSTLAEGPVVESITREGAEMSWRGRRFLLPRQ